MNKLVGYLYTCDTTEEVLKLIEVLGKEKDIFVHTIAVAVDSKLDKLEESVNCKVITNQYIPQNGVMFLKDKLSE